MEQGGPRHHAAQSPGRPRGSLRHLRARDCSHREGRLLARDQPKVRRGQEKRSQRPGHQLGAAAGQRRIENPEAQKTEGAVHKRMVAVRSRVEWARARHSQRQRLSQLPL